MGFITQLPAIFSLLGRGCNELDKFVMNCPNTFLGVVHTLHRGEYFKGWGWKWCPLVDLAALHNHKINRRDCNKVVA